MPHQISGFLIDIDGVLISGNNRIPGASETIEALIEEEIPFLLVTNTTRKSRITIWHHLKRLGFPVEEEQILSAPLAGVQWLKSRGAKNIYLFLSGSAVKDFSEFKNTTANPEYVVIGDVGQDLTLEKLNDAFRLIMRGSKILALQKNRFWQTTEGLTLDAGAIVAALEYASRKRATVVGKPRKDFFQLASEKIDIPLDKLAIVGDDIEMDVQGGQNAGLFGILVKTGKFREEHLKKSNIKPNAVIDSIADLTKYFK